MPTLVRALLDHPSRATRTLQRCTFLVLIDCALTGVRYGKKWWPTTRNSSTF